MKVISGIADLSESDILESSIYDLDCSYWAVGKHMLAVVATVVTQLKDYWRSFATAINRW